MNVPDPKFQNVKYCFRFEFASFKYTDRIIRSTDIHKTDILSKNDFLVGKQFGLY